MSRTFEVLNGTEWLCMPEEVYNEIGGTDQFYKSIVDMIFRSMKCTALFGEREQDDFEGWNARCAAKGETEKIIENDDACNRFFAATLVILDQIAIREIVDAKELDELKMQSLPNSDEDVPTGRAFEISWKGHVSFPETLA